MLLHCSGRKEAVESQRAETEGRRRALEEAAAALTGKLQEVQKARLRLQEMRGRLGVLMLVA